MKVHVKKFDVSMTVKSNGIEFEVRSPDGKKHLGDCYVTMTGLVWCKGKTTRQQGVKIRWKEFTQVMASKETRKRAVDAAKS